MLICYSACLLLYLKQHDPQHGGVYLVTKNKEFNDVTTPYLLKLQSNFGIQQLFSNSVQLRLFHCIVCSLCEKVQFTALLGR